MHISWSGIVFTLSFSWHFSFSWQQLGLSGEVRQQPPFFLTILYHIYHAFGPKWFAFLSCTKELNNLIIISLILWSEIWLIFYHISYHISFQNKQKSSKNQFLAVESSYYKKQREIRTFWQNFNRLVLRAKKIFLIRVKFFYLSLGLFFRFMLFPEASAQVWKTLRYAYLFFGEIIFSKFEVIFWRNRQNL